MRNGISGIAAGLLILLAFSGCGGGGDASVPATPVGAPVNLGELKGFVEARGAAGSSARFNLSGSGNEGTRLTGTIVMTLSGPTSTLTSAGTQTVNLFRRQTTLTNTNTNVTAADHTTYYCFPTGRLFKIVNSIGTVFTPVSQTLLPATAKVGDVGADKELAGSDGSTEKSTWRIDAGTNGDAKFVFLFTSRDGSDQVTSESADTYTLKPDGRISALTTMITFPASGVTVTVAGDRN